jgi:hypothetical protein
VDERHGGNRNPSTIWHGEKLEGDSKGAGEIALPAMVSTFHAALSSSRCFLCPGGALSFVPLAEAWSFLYLFLCCTLVADNDHVLRRHHTAKAKTASTFGSGTLVALSGLGFDRLGGLCKLAIPDTEQPSLLDFPLRCILATRSIPWPVSFPRW